MLVEEGDGPFLGEPGRGLVVPGRGVVVEAVVDPLVHVHGVVSSRRRPGPAGIRAIRRSPARPEPA